MNEPMCDHEGKELVNADGFCLVCGEDVYAVLDPTPWCSGCGAMYRKDYDCGPIAVNE